MRKPMTLAIVLVAACDGTHAGGVAIVGSSLVSVNEGEITELTVSGAESVSVTIPGQPTPDWVNVHDGTQITLSPNCSVVTGTDGPPKLFELEVSDSAGRSSTPLLVQVHPSRTGICTPTMRSCVKANVMCTRNSSVTCDENDPELQSDPIAVSDSAIVQALVLTVVDPDDNDTLLGHPTTDAPLKFHPTDQKRTSFCADLPNHDVVGSFTISYVLGRTPDNSTPIIGAGSYRLKWNLSDNKRIGLELATCASSSGSCTTARRGTTLWCMDATPQADRTIGVRAWLAQGAVPLMGSSAMVQLKVLRSDGSDPQILLASSDAKANPLQLTYDPDVLTSPPLVTFDLGKDPSPGYTFTLLDSQNTPLDTMDVQIKVPCPPP